MSQEILNEEALISWARKEFSIQKTINHPNIVQLKNSFEIWDGDDQNSRIIQMYSETEYCEKGELFELVQWHKGLPE